MSYVSDNIRLTILSDNHAIQKCICEHGFSMWIEAFDQRILFDTGKGIALLPNASTLGCDLSSADILILSHGHYDHCGGISDVLRCNSHVHVYCHPEALVPRYSISPQSASKVVSVQSKEGEALLNVPINRMHWVTDPVLIGGKIGITGTIPRQHPLEHTDVSFFLNPESTQPDPIKDDMALWINTEQGLIIFLGCCHAGLLNTLEYIYNLSGNQRLAGIVGGFHLLNASQDRLERTTFLLKKWNPKFIIPCHCTGDRAINSMQSELGNRVIPGFAGLTWRVSDVH